MLLHRVSQTYGQSSSEAVYCASVELRDGMSRTNHTFAGFYIHHHVSIKMSAGPLPTYS
jgi:hypothetical protein